MMRRTLLALGLLGTVGLVAAAVLGFGASGATIEKSMRLHVFVSLAATLIVMFSHTWIVLYLVTVGRVVTRVTRERGADPDIADRCRQLRRKATPWLLAAIVAVAGAFLLGGGAFTGWIGKVLHQGVAYAALILQVVAVRVEARVLAAYDRLAAALLSGAEADAA
jgi:hypothetical protein